VPPLNPTPASYYIIDASRVPGWNTSARDNKIELWSSGFSSGSGGPVYSITPSQSTAAGDVFFPAGGGSFFAELNATQPSTLSQTVSLAKTGMLSYSFWTRGRAGYDTMKLEVQKLENGAWRTVHSDTYRTGQVWTNYAKRNVLIGESGQQYRFAYTAVNTANGNLTVGNFIDNAAFGLLQFAEPDPVLPNPFVPEVATDPESPSEPAASPPVPDQLTPQQAQTDLSESFAATLSTPALVSGFFPRNTDAAPAGMQRLLTASALAVLNSTMDQEPQQIPLCSGTEPNPRRLMGSANATAQARAECAQRLKTAATQSGSNKRSEPSFTFARKASDYYAERTGLRAWVRGFSTTLTNINNPNGGNWINRADVRAGGGLLGVERSLSPTSQLGVYGSVGSLSVIQTGEGGGSWFPTAYAAGLYGRWSPGSFFVGALAGYGNFNGTQDRGIQLDSMALTAAGQKSADSFTAAVVTGARVNLGANTLLTPSLNLSWSAIQEHGFSESGGELSNGSGNVDVFNLQYASHGTSWTNLDLGVSIAQAMRSGTTLIVPSARLSWFGNWKTAGGNQIVSYDFAP